MENETFMAVSVAILRSLFLAKAGYDLFKLERKYNSLDPKAALENQALVRLYLQCSIASCFLTGILYAPFVDYSTRLYLIVYMTLAWHFHPRLLVSMMERYLAPLVHKCETQAHKAIQKFVSGILFKYGFRLARAILFETQGLLSDKELEDIAKEADGLAEQAWATASTLSKPNQEEEELTDVPKYQRRISSSLSKCSSSPYSYSPRKRVGTSSVSVASLESPSRHS